MVKVGKNIAIIVLSIAFFLLFVLEEYYWQNYARKTISDAVKKRNYVNNRKMRFIKVNIDQTKNNLSCRSLLILILIILVFVSCKNYPNANNIGLFFIADFKCWETANLTVTVPRFGGINQVIELKATTDLPDYTFLWTQIAGDPIAMQNTITETSSILTNEVPQSTLKFRITAKKDACSISKDVSITILENTTNPTFVNINYTGGGSDGTVDKPYTDFVSAYSLAPGAVYLAEGTYPISTTFYLISGKSIYGGFHSSFLREVSTYTTSISDTRMGVNNAYALDTYGANSFTRVDGLSLLGPQNGNWAYVITCSAGSPRLSNLNIQNRGVSPVGDTYAVMINGTCTATLEKNKIYSAVSTSGYCIGVGIFTAGATIKGNSIYGTTGCGAASYAVNIVGVTGFQMTDYNYIDAVGTGTSAYSSGITLNSCTNTIITNQDVSGGQGGSQTQMGVFVDGSANTTIQNNTIYSGVSNSQVSIGIYITNTSSNALIERNSIYTKYRTGSLIAQSTAFGMWIMSDQPHVIANNLILNAPSVGDNYGILLEFAGANIPRIVNNTIMASTSGTFYSRAIQIRNGAKPIITNNILFSDNANGHGFTEWDVGSDPVRFENNLIFNVPNGLYYDEGGSNISTDSGINALGDIPIVGSNITTSPQTGFPLNSIFKDPANGDYSLIEGSPYLTAGKNVYNNAIFGSISTNRNNHPRSTYASWSVGAY